MSDLLDSLDFAERKSRERQLRDFDAKEETFRWIWSSSFVEWLSSQDGVYWISGKPGSGKSTLVEHLIHHDRTKLELQKYNDISWITLHFFFDFRGAKNISNSFEGLLRSLLWQLIDAIPQLDVLKLDTGGHESISDWPEYRLRDALRRSLENVNKGVCIFVDGLDEYEGSILPLIQFLKDLASSKNLLTKLCVSSRPEPIPSQLLQGLPNLSMSEHNASAIRSYCLRTLQCIDSAVCDDPDVSHLSHSIAERADGMFLWARFALDELIQGYSEAETLVELKRRLEEVPHDLGEIYDRMVARLEPAAKEECMVMLQLVCFAKRPLKWQELCVAIKFAMKTDLTIVERIGNDNDSAEASKEYKTFAKRLRAKAVGLLELDKFGGSPPTIRPKLIHRSVQTYLTQKGWQTLGGLTGNNLVRHESLYVETCIRYLRSLQRHCELENYTSQSVLDTLCNRKGYRDLLVEDGNFPFFIYAESKIFQHASALEQSGQSSHALLHKFLTKQVVDLHNRGAPCGICEAVHSRYWFEKFDPIFVAFGHGLILYCKDDLCVRSPPPTQLFWEHVLDIILYSSGLPTEHMVREMMSLVLPNLTTIRQTHLQIATHSMCGESENILRLGLLLEHPSVQNLHLKDDEGQDVTLLSLYADKLFDDSAEVLDLLIDRAKRRGESVRERCGPEGNFVEMLLEQLPSPGRRIKLLMIEKYYQSMSWPFEYDRREVERMGVDFSNGGHISRRRGLNSLVFGQSVERCLTK